MKAARILALTGVSALAAAGLLATGRGASRVPGAPSVAATGLARGAAPGTAPPGFSVAPPQGVQDLESLNAPYDAKLHFVRIRYEPQGRGFFRQRGGPMWAHDYPRGERNFMKIISEMTFADVLVDGSNILTFDDPRLFQYPIAYIIEVGAWEPTDEEAAALGTYLRKGGFLIVDDFRGLWALQNLAYQMERALPGAQLLELDGSHEIFDSFFRVDPHDVIPPYGGGEGPPTWYGVFEDNDREKRLMAIINANNDISEYWEFSDYGFYPIDLSNEAYKLGVNYLIYGLTH